MFYRQDRRVTSKPSGARKAAPTGFDADKKSTPTRVAGVVHLPLRDLAPEHKPFPPHIPHPTTPAPARASHTPLTMARIVQHKQKASEAGDGASDDEGAFRSPFLAGKTTSLTSSSSAPPRLPSSAASKRAHRLENANWDDVKENTGTEARVMDACRKTTCLAGPGQQAVWCWDFNPTDNREEPIKRAANASSDLKGMYPPRKEDRGAWREEHGPAANLAMRTKRNTVRNTIERAAHQGDFPFICIVGSMAQGNYRMTVHPGVLNDVYYGQDGIDTTDPQVSRIGAMNLAAVLLCGSQAQAQFPGGLRSFPFIWNLFVNQTLLGGPRLFKHTYKLGDRYETHVGAYWEAICRYTIAGLLLESAGKEWTRKPQTNEAREMQRKALRKPATAAEDERTLDADKAESVRLLRGPQGSCGE